MKRVNLLVYTSWQRRSQYNATTIGPRMVVESRHFSASNSLTHPSQCWQDVACSWRTSCSQSERRTCQLQTPIPPYQVPTLFSRKSPSTYLRSTRTNQNCLCINTIQITGNRSRPFLIQRHYWKKPRVVRKLEQYDSQHARSQGPDNGVDSRGTAGSLCNHYTH